MADRMRVWALLALGAGCAEPPRFAETRAICGFEAERLDVASMMAPPAYPSTACVDAVLDDFDVRLGPVLAADGLADPYGVTRGEDLSNTALGDLLGAARALLTVDLGERADIDTPWATRAFLDALDETAARTGAREVGALLYDYVTHEVRRTTVGDRTDAAAGLLRRKLILYDLPGGIDGAAVLVHEARHRAGPDHVLCGGEPVCDASTVGSFGFEIAVHAIALDHTEDVLAREIEAGWIDALGERILVPEPGR